MPKCKGCEKMLLKADLKLDLGAGALEPISIYPVCYDCYKMIEDTFLHKSSHPLIDTEWTAKLKINKTTGDTKLLSLQRVGK